ncbi:MAG: hypothetical protein IJ349_05755 [Clostridia bacterium]|nr:hypothetical protein [Clostridia bacterium]
MEDAIMGVVAIVLVVGAVVAWFGLRKLAHKSALIRWWWNSSFKIASYIPFCGWMTCFMVTVDEDDRKEKEFYQQVGKQSDEVGSKLADSLVNNYHQQEAQRQSLERELAQRFGRSDITVSGDGKSVKIGDSDWMPSDTVKRKLGIK